MTISPDVLGLRFLEQSDIFILVDWEAKERPYPWNKEHFEVTLKTPTQKTLIWEEEGRLNGFIVIQLIGDEGYLLNIMSDPRRRGGGLGKTLMKKGLEWAKLNGAKKFFLDVDPLNIPAFKLYKSFGFEIIERRKSGYPHGEDSLLMRKEIL